jgi:hypothetical protein
VNRTIQIENFNLDSKPSPNTAVPSVVFKSVRLSCKNWAIATEESNQEPEGRKKIDMFDCFAFDLVWRTLSIKMVKQEKTLNVR